MKQNGREKFENFVKRFFLMESEWKTGESSQYSRKLNKNCLKTGEKMEKKNLWKKHRKTGKKVVVVERGWKIGEKILENWNESW